MNGLTEGSLENKPLAGVLEPPGKLTGDEDQVEIVARGEGLDIVDDIWKVLQPRKSFRGISTALSVLVALLGLYWLIERTVL